MEGGTAPERAGAGEGGAQLTAGGAGPAPSSSERQVSGRSGGAAAGVRTRSQGRAVPVESMEAEGEAQGLFGQHTSANGWTGWGHRIAWANGDPAWTRVML